jgi:hypothetical protein
LSSQIDYEDGGFFAHLRHSLKEFLMGMAVHEASLTAAKEKAAFENMIFIALFGDFLGIPILRPYYGLRLLPLVCNRFPAWRRNMLRQRDWTDWAFD